MASDMGGAVDVWSHFQEKKHEPEYVRNVLIGLASIMMLLTVPMLICSFVVAGTANAGFDVVITSLALLAWEIGSIWLMQRGPAALSQGFFMGCSVVMNLLTFMTAIYWGQLAQCDPAYEGQLAQYSCAHQGAMRGVCAFAVLVWLLQLPFVALGVTQRHVIIGTVVDMPGAADYPYQDHASASVDPYRYSYVTVSTLGSFTGGAALNSDGLSASGRGNSASSVAKPTGPVYDL